MLPSAAELEYFLEVANTLNLSRASERLGLSQPSLSLAIKRLELSIGTQLFIRHKQGVTLTQGNFSISPGRHPERSEGSPDSGTEIPHVVRDDVSRSF